MFKKIAADALGLSDLGTIVKTAGGSTAIERAHCPIETRGLCL